MQAPPQIDAADVSLHGATRMSHLVSTVLVNEGVRFEGEVLSSVLLGENA
jgi:hypothetical protein